MQGEEEMKTKMLRLTLLGLLVSEVLLSLMGIMEIPKVMSIDTKAAPIGVFGIHSSDALSNQYVMGLSIGGFWKMFEPSEGQYNWTPIDYEISLIESYGKKATIAVLPGRGTPEWVYLAGAENVTVIDLNPNHPTYGQNVTLPVPWDTVYLQKWSNFVAALGQRYDSNPSVAMVRMSGPNAFSLEMILPSEIMNLTVNSSDLVVNAWYTTVDAFSSAFPHTQKELHAHHMFGGCSNLTIPDLVANYSLQMFGNMFMMGTAYLNGKPGVDPLTGDVIPRYASQGAKVGFQMVWSATNDPRHRMGDGTPQENLKNAVDKGLNAGSQYFEIYTADILNPDLQGVLQYIYDNLQPSVHTDLNNDGVVNIIDISIVAKAFGSKPEDPNWNAIADIDKNGIINILDVSKVAKDFGKTGWETL